MTSPVLEAIGARHCKRAFLPRPVPREIIREVLTTASNAPSSKNGQPWKVTVLTGATRDRLSRAICEKFDRGETQTPDYRYGQDPISQFFKARARQVGYALYDLKEIERSDREARRAHQRENYTFFNAPAELIFHLPAGAGHGNFLDLGFFMQNVMLGFIAQGIDTCPQASLTWYSATVRQVAGIAAGRIIVSAMAVGYADPAAPVNAFVPPRVPEKDYIEWRS